MEADWKEIARRRLLALRRPSGDWGYRESTAPAVEPTALAGLALLATDLGVARAAADRLASIQRPDGSLGVTGEADEPGWPTPFASLLWAAVGGYDRERAAALDWLTAMKGLRLPRDPRSPLGHDTQLVGWPWVAGTHSWVEPTAMALLVLGREGKGEHARAVEGSTLLRDRAISTGGWNMGNPKVFGTPLRAFPAPTGLALLALAQTGKAEESVVAPAIAFLRKSTAETLAPASLAWGILGLRIQGDAPRRSEQRLALAYERISRRPVDATAPALLLLASSARALETLGISPRESRISHA